MSMQCLPLRAGNHTFVIPMSWVMNVQQVTDSFTALPAEGERTIPLLDVSAWVGAPTQTTRRFAIIVGTPEQALCLLVDGVLPARTADAFTRLPGALRAVGSPFSAFWSPDRSRPPLPVLDVPRLLTLTAPQGAAS